MCQHLWMLILPFPQHLYSIHLADQAEDCTLQLADHIKVSGDNPSLLPLFHLCVPQDPCGRGGAPAATPQCSHSCPVLALGSGNGDGEGEKEWECGDSHVSGWGLYPAFPKGRTSVLHPLDKTKLDQK